MALNPMMLFKIKKMWSDFTAAHPKVLPFFKEVGSGYLGEGTIIDITVTDPNGRNIRCNMVVRESDMELMKSISEMGSDSLRN